MHHTPGRSLFFCTDPAPTEIHTLSLHDALPICEADLDLLAHLHVDDRVGGEEDVDAVIHVQDRKSTRLNSSHVAISYAVFCLKKKNTNGAGQRRSAGSFRRGVGRSEEHTSELKS